VLVREGSDYRALVRAGAQPRQPVTLVGRGDHRHTFISMQDVTAFLLVRFIQPGESLPGLPDVVSDLAASMEHYESVFDTSALAQQMGVRQMTARESLRQMLGRPVSPQGDQVQ
jgi:hypothetical protein